MKFKIIVLGGHELSERLGSDCIAAAAKLGHNVERFNGINGHDAKTYLATFRIQAAKPGSKIERPGTLGCLLSHYLLWRECVNAGETFAIFEHDGMLIRAIPHDIERRFDNVLKLDGLDQFGDDYDVNIGSQRGRVEVLRYINPVPHDHGVGNYFRGSYAYLIKPAAARLLLGWISLYGFYPADIQINERVFPRLYCAVPSIARLHPFYDSAAAIKAHSLTQNLPHRSA